MDKISNTFYKAMVTGQIAFSSLSKALKSIVDMEIKIAKEKADIAAFIKAVGPWETQRPGKQGSK